MKNKRTLRVSRSDVHVAVQLHLIFTSESRVRDEVGESVVCLEKLS